MTAHSQIPQTKNEEPNSRLEKGELRSDHPQTKSKPQSSSNNEISNNNRDSHRKAASKSPGGGGGNQASVSGKRRRSPGKDGGHFD